MNRALDPAKSPLYAMPEGLQRPLRVVLVGPPLVPGWVQAFCDLAANCAWLELITRVDNDATLPPVRNVGIDIRGLIALERVLLGRRRSLVLGPMRSNATEIAMPGASPGHVQALEPDLVIAFGAPGWAGRFAPGAAHGCWQVDPSLTDRDHAGLSLLSPLIRRETATQAALILQPEDAEPIDLAASWGRTRATSFLMQREDVFRKLPVLLLRGLHRMADGHVPTAAGSIATLRLQPHPPLGRAAGLRGLLSIVRAAPGWMTAWLRNGYIGWTLVLRLKGTTLDPESPVIGSHALLKAPKGWWADPCLVASAGRRLLFVEEMLQPKSWNANIACVELTGGGARRLGPVLEEPGHLSFPQVFQWRDQWFMTVESGDGRRVSLYRATEFPLHWERHRDLLTGWKFVDPTLHRHDGRWYLFTNVSENGNSTCDELFLFVAEALEGPFLPHPASPIACDVRRARMAGRLFEHSGRLIRPAQDCAPGYGNAVIFNEVLELSPTVYRERQLSRLAPYLSRRVDGCHTYSTAGGIEVLDVLGRPPMGGACLQVFDGPGTAGDGLRVPDPVTTAILGEPLADAGLHPVQPRAAQDG